MSGPAGEGPHSTTVVLEARAEELELFEWVEAEPPPPIEPGTAVGRYVVHELLAQGGMGRVYVAHDPELDRRIALKLLSVRRSSSGQASRARERLQREARALARVAHPNVIAIHDVGTHGDEVFIAMELVEGRTLRAWLHEQKRSPREVVDVLREAGRGLLAAHEAGLVHRDFKPDNVIVGQDGRVRVLDFGLARASLGGDSEEDRTSPEPSSPSAERPPSSAGSGRRDLGPPLTNASAIIGTPGYMAPEQYRREPLDAPADQFSFCVTLYEALHGRHPFGDTLGEVTKNVPLGKLRAEIDPRLPRNVREALRRGLRASPAERFPTMQALLAALSPSRRRLGLGAIAALLSVAIGVAAVLALRPVPCRDGPQRLADVWDAAARERVHQAFARTGVPFADSAWATVDRRLGALAAQWRTSDRDACEDTLVRRVQSLEVMDLRMGCLSTRRHELRAAVQALAAADAATVERAADAVVALESPAQCDDVQALRRGARRPSEPGRQVAFDRVRQQLAEARVLRVTGAVARARALLLEASAAAEELRDPALRAEVLVERGALEYRLGELPASERSYREAALSAEAASHDGALAQALLGALKAAAFERDPGSGGVELERRAEAIIGRLGDPPALRGYLHLTQGAILGAAARSEDSLAHSRKAVELLTRVHGAQHPDVLLARRHVGAALSDLGRFEEASHELAGVLATEEAVLGKEHPNVAETLLALASRAGDGLRYDDAIAYAERALRIRERALGPEHVEVALTLATLGVSRAWAGRYAEARRDVERALAILERDPATAKLAGSPLGTLGDLALRERRHAEALRLFQRARALDVASRPDGDNVALDDAGLGQAYLGLGQTARALPLLEDAARRVAPDEQHALAPLRFALARAIVATPGGDRKRARRLAEDARAFYARAPGWHRADLAEIDAWLARKR